MILMTTALTFINVGLKVILKDIIQFQNRFSSVSVLQLSRIPAVFVWLLFGSVIALPTLILLNVTFLLRNIKSPLKVLEQQGIFALILFVVYCL